MVQPLPQMFCRLTLQPRLPDGAVRRGPAGFALDSGQGKESKAAARATRPMRTGSPSRSRNVSRVLTSTRIKTIKYLILIIILEN